MKKSFFTLIIVIVVSTYGFSQQKKTAKKDTITTQIIEIETTYNPKIADANKIKETPKIQLLSERKKKKLQYIVFSVPVASTFVPKSGVAKQINIGTRERIYKNFLAVGFGNFNAPYLETYLHNFTRFDSEIGLSAKYIAAMDNINNTLLDSDFSNLNTSIFYKKEARYFDWKVTLKGSQDNYSWYGIEKDIFSEGILNNINENQTYNAFKIIGNIDFIDSYLQDSEIALSYFSDATKSSEYNFNLNTNLAFPVNLLRSASSSFTIATKAELLQGTFQKGFTDLNKIDYSIFTAELHPNFSTVVGGFSFKIGFDFFAAFDTKNKVNHFLIYPDLQIQKSLIKENLTIYTGVLGNLQTNTYQQYSSQNPFISPTQFITQTNQKYDAFLGFNGLIDKKLSYNISLNAKEEQDKPLFLKNYSKSDGTNDSNNGIQFNGYEYGNSFSVVYDDVKTIAIGAEIGYDISRNLRISSDINFNNYTLTKEAYAWNLPNFEGSINGNYSANKWYANTSIFIISNRKDVTYSGASFNRNDITTLKAFVDANLNGGYHFSDKFTAFIKISNFLNTNYQRFADFNVQGLQALGGLTYRFDF